MMTEGINMMCADVELIPTDEAEDIKRKLDKEFSNASSIHLFVRKDGRIFVCNSDFGRPSMSFKKADDVFYVELSNVVHMVKPHAFDLKYCNDLYEYYVYKEAFCRDDEVMRFKYRRMAEKYSIMMDESLLKATDALDSLVMLFMSRYVTRNQKWD